MPPIWILFVPWLSQDVLIEVLPRHAGLVSAYVDLPSHRPFDDLALQETQQVIHETLLDLGHDEVRGVIVLARDARGAWVPLPELLPPVEPPPERPWEQSGAKQRASGGAPYGIGSPVLVGANAPGAVAGVLSGKHVYVSQGHGWYWSEVLGRWATQRGNTNGIVEDLVNVEGIDHYLLPYLLNAGATVFPMREPDKSPHLAVVDDDAATLTGDWQPGPAGWKAGTTTLKSGVNPFALGSSRVTTTVATAATATATFTAALPAPGAFGVHVAWSHPAGATMAPDARLTVHHAGGATEVRLDQRGHAGTWMYLGKFTFGASAQLVFDNRSDAPGTTVSIDAIRIGGGVGVIQRGDGAPPAAGPTSGRPRFEECSRYHAQLQGAPTTVYDSSSDDHNDDVSTRSRYAAWQHEKGEDAVFVSWHSNAPNPGTGTSTWVYGPNPPDGTYDFTGAEGSDALAKAVHAAVVNAIRAEWDPGWKDRGINSAWFGELNPKYNNEMPSTLVEVAFHDTPADAKRLVEPRFRRTVARAVRDGVIQYFATRDGVAAHFPPEPPLGLVVTGDALGGLTARWTAPPDGEAPTAYRVYVSTDGFDWRPVLAASSTQSVLPANLLSPGVPILVRVSSTNDAGESFPTAAVAATPAHCATSVRGLLVQGFTRLDSFSLPVENLAAFNLGEVTRLDQDVVNTFDYALQHAAALAAHGVVFDGAEATALRNGSLALTGYAFADWILGEQSTVDETFTSAEQLAVKAWLAGGGRLFASGAELLWDLVEKGTPADQAFAKDVLHVGFAGDDAQSTSLVEGGSFTAEYNVQFPDVLTAESGATALWHYTGGTIAAVQHADTATGARVVVAGFPFETLATAADRTARMAEVLAALGVAGSASACVMPATLPEPAAEAVAAPEAVAVVEAAPEPVAAVEPAPAAIEPPSVVAEPSVDGGGLGSEVTVPVRHAASAPAEGCSPSRVNSRGWLIALGLLVGLWSQRVRRCRSARG